VGEFYNPLQDLLTHLTPEGMVDPSVFKFQIVSQSCCESRLLL
jgi:hypothetical protein